MVMLDTGERLRGRLLWDEQRGQRLARPLLGKVSLDEAELVGLAPSGAEAAASAGDDAGADARAEALEREQAARLARRRMPPRRRPNRSGPG